jgi:amino acid adenylation domain-containing protein
MSETRSKRDVSLAAVSSVVERDFWIELFKGGFNRSFFPYDHPSNEEEGVMLTVPVEFHRRLMEPLMKLSNRSDVRLHLILLAAYIALLRRFTEKDDITVGVPIYKQEVEGDLVNTALALRCPVDEGVTFKELLLGVRQRLLEAADHQNYPLEALCYKLDLRQAAGYFPLFDSALLLENIHDPGYLSHLPLNLVLSFQNREGTLTGKALYNSRLYEASTIESMIDHFLHFLGSVLEDVDVVVDEVDLLLRREKEKILNQFNGTAADYPNISSVHKGFENQVERTPDSPALLDPSHGIIWTYRQLNSYANRVAHFLQSRGIGRGDIVAIMIERNFRLIGSVLGALKAGAAYLPIDLRYPPKRVSAILRDSNVSILLTGSGEIKGFDFVELRGIEYSDISPVVTRKRAQIKDFEGLPLPDRSLVDYGKYHQYIGIAMAKHAVSIQSSRGCPFNCAYCHKIWPKSHVVRGADHVLEEMKRCLDAGVRRFVFIDDIFNLAADNSRRLLERIAREDLDVQLFFPNGLRGDILTRDFIDLMVEAGTINVDLALETASPRLQRLIGKNLNLEAFEENVQYITSRYPQVMLEMEMMTGFPSETEEEAMMTMDFVKRQQWIHFPNLNILKIYPNTDMYRLAIENGVTDRQIQASTYLPFHQMPETLPFSKDFAHQFQASFMNDYFFSKERLRRVLPYQARLFSEDEMVQKYDSYLPGDIGCWNELLRELRMEPGELGDVSPTLNGGMAAPDFSACFQSGGAVAVQEPDRPPFRILLMDLSLLFSSDSKGLIYDTIEAPLGLMSLMSYLNERFGSEIEGQVVKSRMDFDSYEQLKERITAFKPHLIGIRTLSFFRDFFHCAVAMLKAWFPDIPVISGGPYATSDYLGVLRDRNLDLVVLGEGERTLGDLVEMMIANNDRFPPEGALKTVDGIAFVPDFNSAAPKAPGCDVCLVDQLEGVLDSFRDHNPQSANTPSDLLYLISTSGSTGKPKSVMVEHRNLLNLILYQTQSTLLNLDTNVLQFASIGFDVSAQEIFSTLLSGGQLVLMEEMLKHDIENFTDFVHRHRVEVLFLPPAFLKYYFTQSSRREGFLPGVKHIVAAGEQLVVPQAFKEYLAREGVTLHNHYGPSETHVVTTLAIEPSGPHAALPTIGTPIGNNRIYIMDSHRNLKPVGVAGELVIAGANVGRGYCNNSELTHEKYLPDPFIQGERMYRSGDLARFLRDGSIEFLGRIDSQVKIRGFRVEIEEITAKLSEFPGVLEAVVIERKTAGGESYLCGYVTGKADLDEETLREELSDVLPDYMVPAYIVAVQQIPLTVRGKIDRDALPEPDGHKKNLQYIAPRDRNEKLLVEIWSDVLEIPRQNIGVHDNFFNLGGHSLKATIMLARINRQFSIKIPLAQIFEAPTVAGVAAMISEVESHREQALGLSEKRDHYPLSSAQKRLYVLRNMERDSVAYNLPMALVFDGELDREKLTAAFGEIVSRHDSLRTFFQLLSGEPVQRIAAEIEVDLEFHDWQGRKSEGDDDPVAALIRPFDLSFPPLLRLIVARLSPLRHIFLLDMHHIITDGTSMGIIVEEFMELYAGHTLAPVEFQYKDYSVWQDREIAIHSFRSQRDFWRREFEEGTPALELPTDFAGAGDSLFAGESIQFRLEPDIARRLRQLALDRDVTLFMVVKALLHVLLSKLSGQEDIVVGTAHAGRGTPELERVVGMLVNTLAVRCRPQPHKRFSGFLEEIKAKVLAVFDNQDYQFDDLVASLGYDRTAGGNPLFSVMLTLQNMYIPQMEIPGLQLKPYDFKNKTAMFDLTVVVNEEPDTVAITIIYRTALFREESVRRFFDFYISIANQVAVEPHIPLNDISLLSDEERGMILQQFNGTSTQYPREATVHRLFARQAEETPHRIAVTYYDEQVTYRGLAAMAAGVARKLAENGVAGGTVVGIVSTASPMVPAALLGILAAGGVYFPVDLSAPMLRQAALLKDCAASVLMGKSELLKNLSQQDLDCRLVEFDDCPSAENPAVFGELASVGADCPAYVMYTSGSTGIPKGVLVKHRNIVRLVKNTNFCEYNAGWRLLQTGALSFDASTFEIWGSLLNGMTLCLADKPDILAPTALKQLIHRHDIQVMWMTAPLFNQMVEADLSLFDRIGTLIVGGDVLSATHINRVLERFPGILLLNGYGPTENTTFSTTHWIRRPYSSRIPIGAPIANSTAYVVDREGRLLPPGVPGELWVGGDGVALGYLNDPELTAKKFIEADYDPTVYRTGDRARWLPDGTVDFLGRIDQQVKIRGFRVEPGEIEAQLARHPLVREAVVSVLDAGDGEKSLCAYVVARGEVPEDDFRLYLKGKLPEYMMPRRFVPVDSIPLNSNGKIDYAALPKLQMPRTSDSGTPMDPVRRELKEIWSGILGMSPQDIGVQDDFFSLGGHSLKATVLAARIEKAFGVSIPLVELFAGPTIEALAQTVKRVKHSADILPEPFEERESYPLCSAQERLFVMWKMDPDLELYNMPFIERLTGPLDVPRLKGAIQEIVRRHEGLRTYYHEDKEGVRQRVLPAADFQLEIESLSPATDSGVDQVMHLFRQFIRPFDLRTPPLLRVGLARLEEDHHILLVDMHHSISDGTSVGIFLREFMTFYSGSQLPALDVQYRDYAYWQQRIRRFGSLEAQEAFWLKRLEGCTSPVPLPLDFPRPKDKSFLGGHLFFHLDLDVKRRIKLVMEEEGVTLYMFFLAIYNVLLSMITGLEDIVVGTAIAGRKHAALQDIIGMFVNMLAMRNYPSAGKTFRQFLAEVKENTVTAYQNQDCQFFDLVKALEVRRQESGNTLVNVTIVLQNMEIPEWNVPELELQSLDYEYNISKYDLSFIVLETDDGIDFVLEYAAALFKEETMRTLFSNYRAIVSQVLDNRDVVLGDVETSYNVYDSAENPWREQDETFDF